MPYGLKYQTQFTSQSDANNPERNYTLQFLFKEYAGNPVSVDGGGITVIQRCTLDDPMAPIKGQSLDIRLENAGSLPITSFQSEDDDGVQVKLLDANSNILFIGFLVQDDFTGLMVDYNHEITLSANDGLGLLKGVILSDAEVRRKFYSVRRTNGVDTVVYVWVTDTAFYPQAGNIIEFLGVAYTIATAVYEFTNISGIGYNWTITLTTSTGGIAYGDEYIYLTGEVNLLNRNSLLSMIAVCLGQTNLSLVTNIFHNLYESEQDAAVSTFEQTLIDSQTFLNGELYDDCYTALTKILETFKCSIFQANGQWNIVCWTEGWRYTNNAIPGFVYDETWTAAGTTVFTNNVFIGPDPQYTQPIFPLETTSYRGWKFSRKKFDYVQPKYLLRNWDLQQLGPLLSQTTHLGVTYSNYVAIGWEGGFGTPVCFRCITVETDSAGTELDRYITMYGPTFDGSRSIASETIECNAGDRVKFSFSFKTNVSQTAGTIIFSVRLTDGTLNYYVDDVPVDNGAWQGGPGYNYILSSAGNTNQWANVTIESSIAPISGLLTCYLALAIVSPPYDSTQQTYYKDLRLEVIPYINDTSKIIGHVHKQEQAANKKNNQDLSIVIDDTPRNSIKGTLFLTTKTGLLQNRTRFWRYPPDGNGWTLGEHTTLEELRWRQKTRQKYEGGFTGLWQNGVPVSLLSMAIFDFDTTKNYTFGLLTINYKNNSYNGSLWEIHDTDDDPEFNPDYEFKYLYSTT